MDYKKKYMMRQPMIETNKPTNQITEEERKKKMNESRCGDKNSNWKGGIGGGTREYRNKMREIAKELKCSIKEVKQTYRDIYGGGITKSIEIIKGEN